MISRFLIHYQQNIVYDLFTKINFNNVYLLSNLNKININISDLNLLTTKIKIVDYLLLLELITNQKSKITISKKNKIHLKIKKNNIIGCKLTLYKKKNYEFLEYLILFIFPYQKNFKGINFSINNFNVINFNINKWSNFLLKINKYYFDHIYLESLQINLHFKNTTFLKSCILLNSFNFPLKIKNS